MSAIKIEDLSAYSLNQVQQSLNSWNQTNKEAKKLTAWETFGGDWDVWRQGLKTRPQYKEGKKNSPWGIEDEYRWMTGENDFNGVAAAGSGYAEEDKKKKEDTQSAPTDNPNQPTVNYQGNTGGGNPSSTTVEGKNQESYSASEDTAARNDRSNLSRWGGSASKFGFADFDGAMNSGYTKGDINGWLSGIGGDKINTGGDWYKGLQETNSGKVSKMFGAAGSGTENANWFGRADLLANRKMGLSDYQILSYLDNNMDSLRGNNAKGVAGGIYEELNSMRPVDPKNLLTGGSNLGNAGYADAVKPNRSEASSSTRSSYGTSQFNRKNFGNKKKSGISSNGLTI